MLRRFDDWPARLHAFVRARQSLPYVYGETDCASFAQAAILEMTGIDVMPGVVRPTSRIAAARFLLAGGYGDIEGLATELLGPPLESARLAGRGDIISFEANGECHLGVVTGLDAATPGKDGILWVHRALWRRGWRV